MTQVFLSHSTVDADFALKLAKDLRSAGIPVWKAPESIINGEEWVAAIERGLSTSTHLLLLKSPAAVKSKWVKFEFNAALTLEKQGKMRIIPVDYQPCKPPLFWTQFQHVKGIREEYHATLFAILARLREEQPINPPAPTNPGTTITVTVQGNISGQLNVAGNDVNYVGQPQTPPLSSPDVEPDSEAEMDAPDHDERIEDLLMLADEAYQAGSWDDAKTALEQAQKHGANDTRIADLRDQIRDARTEAAEQEKHRRQAGGLVGYARQLFDAEDWDGAEGKVAEALEIIPDHDDALELLNDIQQARDHAARHLQGPFHKPQSLEFYVPEMVPIPAGPFLMGSPGGGLLDLFRENELRSFDEPNQFELDLDYDYAIGRYPVTVGQYRLFVQDGGYTNRGYWTEAGWRWRGERTHPKHWNDTKWTNDDGLPVVGVSWYEAYAYTRWLSEIAGDDYRLPTEAEWEKAARGGLQIPDARGSLKANPNPARIWPWGNEQPVQNLCNFEISVGQAMVTSPVTSHAAQANAQPYGLYHMAGNVWEWCLSEWAEPYQYPEENDPHVASPRVLRGGSWAGSDSDVRCSTRNHRGPSHRASSVGFRVGGVVPVRA